MPLLLTRVKTTHLSKHDNSSTHHQTPKPQSRVATPSPFPFPRFAPLFPVRSKCPDGWNRPAASDRSMAFALFTPTGSFVAPWASKLPNRPHPLPLLREPYTSRRPCKATFFQLNRLQRGWGKNYVGRICIPGWQS